MLPTYVVYAVGCYRHVGISNQCSNHTRAFRSPPLTHTIQHTNIPLHHHQSFYWNTEADCEEGSNALVAAILGSAGSGCSAVDTCTTNPGTCISHCCNPQEISDYNNLQDSTQPRQPHCTTGCGKAAVNGSCFPPLAFYSTSTWNSKTKNELNWPATVYIGDGATVFELPPAANPRDKVRRRKFSGYNGPVIECQLQDLWTTSFGTEDGERASCADLADGGYCSHDDHGDKVMQECPKACGLCDTLDIGAPVVDTFEIDPNDLRYKLFWTHHSVVNAGSKTTTQPPTTTTRKEAPVTVIVGASTDNPKWIDSKGVFRCDDEPINECCGDTFAIKTNDNHAKIDVGRIKVKRTDVDDGWGQNLALQCYRWADNEDALAVNFTADYVGTTPPYGLDPGGTESDPGGTYVAIISGTITSTPKKAGKYTMWLLLEENPNLKQSNRLIEYGLPESAPATWNQLVVAQHTFNVVDNKPPFEIVHFERQGAAVAGGGTAADDTYIATTDLTETLELIVGDVTRIAPINLETFKTSGREGRPITFALTGAPEGIFVAETTGAIVAAPQGASNNVVVVGLNAKAGGGEGDIVLIQNISIRIKMPAPFVLETTPDTTRRYVGQQYTDPSSMVATLCVVNTNYKISPLTLDETKTTLSDGGDVTTLKYTLEGAPDSWFVAASTGMITGQFEAAGNYNFTLVAADRRKEEQIVETFNFSVVEKPDRPSIQTFDRAESDGDLSRYTVHVRGDSVTKKQCKYDELCEFNKLTVTSPTENVAGTFSYAVQVVSCTSSNGVVWPKTRWPQFLVNSETGYVAGTLDADLYKHQGSCTLDFTATAPGYTSQKIERVEVTAVISELAVEQQKAKVTATTTTASTSSTVAFILLLIAAYKYRQYTIRMRPVNFEQRFAAMLASGEISPEQLRSERKPREIRRHDLVFVKAVGHGQFGEVWQCVLDESYTRDTPECTVAAKTVLDSKESSEATQELLSEASVMAQVSGHHNLVSIIGVITRGDPLVLVIQFCEHGSALDLLKQRAAGGAPLPWIVKMEMALEVSLGMEHLSDLKFIHRDLAARNVLVADGVAGVFSTQHAPGEAALVCKIADFGLSRGGDNGDNGGSSGSSEAYYKSSKGVFPVRWTAPEAMETMRFTIACDVWSFGVVLVEIMQDGNTPYHGSSNPDVMKLTMSGGRHPKPTGSVGCSDGLYKFMLQCWHQDPALRPTFAKVVRHFKEVVRTRAGPAVAPRANVLNASKPAGGAKPKATFNNEYNTFGFDDDADDDGKDGGESTLRMLGSGLEETVFGFGD